MLKDSHETVLLDGLAESNEKIYDYLFHYYYSGLVAFAMKYVTEMAVAEDIVQEFYYKLWLNRTRLSIRQSIKSYFFSSVKNLCIDFIRHKEAGSRVIESLKNEAKENLDTESDFLVESELRVRINEAMNKLPGKCRKVFMMYRFEGLKPNEIAKTEDISVRTVEGHIGKAMKILREELKPYLPASLITLILNCL